MFTAQSKIHSALTFQTGITVIGCTGFSLNTDSSLSVLIQILYSRAVTVFPVVTVIENTFESQFMVLIDIEIKCCRITLALTGNKVLTHLVIIDIRLSVFAFFPHKLGIIRTRRSILIRSRKQHSQPVMKETVTISES